MRHLSLLSLILLNACSTTLELPPLAERAPYVHPSDLPETKGLPELMTLSTGEPVRSERDWQRARRPEIAGLVEHYVYGTAPAAPTDMRAELREECMTEDGKAWREQIRLHVAEGVAIDLLIYSPAHVPNAPCFLGLNFCGNHATTSEPQVLLPGSWMSNSRGGRNGRATEEQRGKQSPGIRTREALLEQWPALSRRV